LQVQKTSALTTLSPLVEAFGFELSRTRGSHHIYEHPGVPEILNLQNVSGQVKPYQVRQFLQLVEQYSLKLEE
jgi:predicted RNA binding protein YcfA (HicA-like mRNA interferase family)